MLLLAFVASFPGFATEADDLRALDAKISNSDTQLRQLLTRFTERHPDVIVARRMLDDLRAQRAELVAKTTPLDEQASDLVTERVAAARHNVLSDGNSAAAANMSR